MSLTTLPAATPPILEPSDLPKELTPTAPAYLSHPYRLAVEQYDQMVEAGIFGKRNGVELIEGIRVAKVGRNLPHIQAGK